MHTIYYLENPLNGSIFYVGVTRRDLEERLMGHCASPSTSTGLRLRDAGIKPLIKELDTVVGGLVDEALKVEEYWIHQFCAWGFSLENRTIAFGRKRLTNPRVYTKTEISILCSEKILSLSYLASGEDRTKLSKILGLSYSTVCRYLNGEVSNVDKGIEIYLFLKNKLKTVNEVLVA